MTNIADGWTSLAVQSRPIYSYVRSATRTRVKSKWRATSRRRRSCVALKNVVQARTAEERLTVAEGQLVALITQMESLFQTERSVPGSVNVIGGPKIFIVDPPRLFAKFGGAKRHDIDFLTSIPYTEDKGNQGVQRTGTLQRINNAVGTCL